MGEETDNLYFTTQFWGDGDGAGDGDGGDGPDKALEGYNKLVNHLASSRRAAKEVEVFLQEYGKMEVDHAKKMGDVARKFATNKNPEEYDKIRVGVEEVGKFLEKIAKMHEELGQQCQSAAGELNRRLTTLKDSAKEQERLVDRATRDKGAAKKKSAKAHALYRQRLTEMDAAKEHRNTLTNGREDAISTAGKMKVLLKSRANPDTPQNDLKEQELSRELNKAEERVKASSSAVDESLQAYDSSVEEVNSKQAEWNQKYEDACLVFQKDEEDRYGDVLKRLKLVLNKNLEACLSIKRVADDLRDALNACDRDEDLKGFVRVHRTGQSRPRDVRTVGVRGPELAERRRRSTITSSFRRAHSSASYDTYYDADFDDAAPLRNPPGVGTRLVAATSFDPSRDLTPGAALQDELPFGAGSEAIFLSADEEGGGQWWNVEIGGREGWVPALMWRVEG